MNLMNMRLNRSLVVLVPVICLGAAIGAAPGPTAHDKIIGTLASETTPLEEKIDALNECPNSLAEEAYKTVSAMQERSQMDTGKLVLRAIAAERYATKCGYVYDVQKQSDLNAEAKRLYIRAYNEDKHRTPLVDVEYGNFVFRKLPSHFVDVEAGGTSHGYMEENNGLEIARKAVEKNPEWAFGHGVLAEMYLRLAMRSEQLAYRSSQGTMTPTAVLHRAGVEAAKALRLNDRPVYHTTLAGVLCEEHRYSEMKTEVLRAIRGGNNGSEVHILLSVAYNHEHKSSDAKREDGIAQSLLNQGL